MKIIEKKKEENIILENDIALRQGDKKVILEKGDRIQILEKDYDLHNLIRKGTISKLEKSLNKKFSKESPWIVTDIREKSSFSGPEVWYIKAYSENGNGDWKFFKVIPLKGFDTIELSKENIYVAVPTNSIYFLGDYE